MAETPKINGCYVGRSKIREGMEAMLAPTERRRIAKGEDAFTLILNSDGTFISKKTTAGRYELKGDTITCIPESFNGSTLDSMKQMAAKAGREFGLAWLFDPFVLHVQGSALILGEKKDLIYVEYLKN